jgi:DNA-binding response OmpR family regulator
VEATSNTVLVVEDDHDTRAALAEALERAGYRVLLAADGRAALDQLARDVEPPALIVLDWVMPVMSGMEFLTFLTADREHRVVPVLVLSALDRAFNVNQAPIAAVLTKPVRMRLFLDVVARLCHVPKRDPADYASGPVEIAEDATVPNRRPSRS